MRLASSDPALAPVPAETLVSQGRSMGPFPVTTGAVSANTTVTITATWFDIARTTTITLTPRARRHPTAGFIDTPRQISVRSDPGGSAAAVLRT